MSEFEQWPSELPSRQALLLVRAFGLRALAGELGVVIFTDHARDEMDALGTEEYDVVNALATASKCSWQPQHETWKVKGLDRFEDVLVVAVDIQDCAVVVTVFA